MVKSLKHEGHEEEKQKREKVKGQTSNVKTWIRDKIDRRRKGKDKVSIPKEEAVVDCGGHRQAPVEIHVKVN